MLSNRELAALILTALFIVAIMFVRGVRKSSVDILKFIFGKHLAPVFLSYLAYAAAVVLLLNWLRLWQFDLLKNSIVVALFVGFPLLFKAGSAKSGTSLVRQAFVETLGVSALVVFYLNLASLPVVAELGLQLLILFTAAMAAFASTDQKYRPVAKLMNGILGVISVGLLIFTTVVLITTWAQQDLSLIGRSLLISIWYPFALLPFIYLVSFYAQAQLVMVMLPYFNDRNPLPLRVQIAVLMGFHGSTRYAASFVGDWRTRIGGVKRFDQARQLMAEYRASVRDPRRKTELR